MIDCKYCGRHIPYDANVCPYCARSLKEHKDNLPTENETPVTDTGKQYVETSEKAKKSNGWLYAIIVILLLMLLSIVGYMMLHGIGLKDSKSESQTDTTNVEQTTAISAEEITSDKPLQLSDKKAKKEIIVNGEGVRLRFAPSLNSGYLKTKQGGTLSVQKGTRLQCVGEEGDWYKVVYQGKQYYMSKQFCVLAH